MSSFVEKNNATLGLGGNDTHQEFVFNSSNTTQIEKDNQPQFAAPNEANFIIAQQFLTVLDEDAESFTLLARVIHGTIDEYYHTLCRLQKEGAGVFVTVNKTDLKGRSKVNVVGARAFFR